jgi:hypothetical protein
VCDVGALKGIWYHVSYGSSSWRCGIVLVVKAEYRRPNLGTMSQIVQVTKSHYT